MKISGGIIFHPARSATLCFRFARPARICFQCFTHLLAERHIFRSSAARLWFKPGQVILQFTLRQTNGGVSVVNLSLASNRTRKDEAGEKISVPDWFRITVYGRDAEVLSQYAHKGSALTFNGRLQTDSYFDREGAQRVTTVLIADSFEFMPRGKRSEGEETGSRNKERTAPSAVPNDDSDIPF